MTPSTLSKRIFAKDVIGTLAAGHQAVNVEWRAGALTIDEPLFNGGQDLGPDPFTLVLASLVGCTLTTLRMYARRKGWDIGDMTVHANMVQQPEPFKTLIFRRVVIEHNLSDEQRERLLYIAKHCPVAKLLEGEIVIDTALGGSTG